MLPLSLPTHGVLIRLNNTGVFLIGESGVGKSEAALQLIYQGAVLICDDAPQLIADKNNGELIGLCADDFFGLMHLRDLGIINIIQLLGHKHCKKSQRIDFIVELIKPETDFKLSSNLNPAYKSWGYHDSRQKRQWKIPGIGIHVYPHRNIPLLIQTAITQFVCSNSLYRLNQT